MIFKNLKKIVSDIDGVLTDGKFFYDKNKKILKQFGPHDSDGIKLLKSVGIEVAAISADKRGFEITKKRLEHMGVEVYLVSEKDRLKWFNENAINESTGFVGDGLFDIPVLRTTKFSFAPKNAPDIVKENANYVLNTCGGDGVFLEIALIILKDSHNEVYKLLREGKYERNF